MIFRKSLTMSSVARNGSTTGEIVNIMSSDAERVGQVAFTLINAVLVPAQCNSRPHMYLPYLLRSSWLLLFVSIDD
jgi:hypothetical protein